MVLEFLKTFVLTTLAMLGLLGFVYGLIAGLVALVQGISSRNKEPLIRAAILFVVAILSILCTTLLWPAVRMTGN